MGISQKGMVIPVCDLVPQETHSNTHEHYLYPTPPQKERKRKEYLSLKEFTITV